MFLFQISNYDEPMLDVETAELLRQRLKAHSRRTLPGMWRVTDLMNNYADGGSSCKKQKKRGYICFSSGPCRATETYSHFSRHCCNHQKHLWLLIYGSEKALLLQKKDLICGDVDLFASYLLKKTQDD